MRQALEAGMGGLIVRIFRQIWYESIGAKPLKRNLSLKQKRHKKLDSYVAILVEAGGIAPPSNKFDKRTSTSLVAF